jgi:hypothetical protein
MRQNARRRTTTDVCDGPRTERRIWRVTRR